MINKRLYTYGDRVELVQGSRPQCPSTTSAVPTAPVLPLYLLLTPSPPTPTLIPVTTRQKRKQPTQPLGTQALGVSPSTVSVGQQPVAVRQRNTCAHLSPVCHTSATANESSNQGCHPPSGPERSTLTIMSKSPALIRPASVSTCGELTSCCRQFTSFSIVGGHKGVRFVLKGGGGVSGNGPHWSKRNRKRC